MMAPSPPRQAPSADPPQPPAATIDHLREEILPPRTRRRPRRQLSSTPAAAREPRRPPVRGEPPMAPSPPPGAPSADPPAAAKTTIHDVLEDIMRGILLRLHSSLSLGCAMLVCRSWAGIASKSGFHQSFRKTHPSSPLIGLFTNDDEDQYVLRPTVHVIHESDSDMAAVASKGDLLLYKLKSASGARWRIQDSRNGVLLLCRDDDNSLWVHNPVSGRQPVRIQDRPDDVTMDGKFVAHCLLDGTVQQCVAVDSFRVVSVQQFRREIRAVEYDSSTGEWRCHEWTSQPPDGGCLSIHPEWGRPMYAAGHIFWVYSTAFLFVLDTGTMEFLARPFPRKWKQPDKLYSIGEIEDGTGYLVCLRGKSLLANNFNPRLQVWSINADNNKLELDLKKEVPMSQLAIPPNMSCDVYTVINGLAVLTFHSGPHFVVDLQKETLLATFSKKLSGRGYLYQLSWPHAINSGSTPPLQDNNIDNLLSTLSEGSIRSSHDVGESVYERSGGDEPSKLSPDNEIKEPPTLSYLDNTCSQSQYMDPPDVNEGSANEAAPCESLHILKSRDTPQDDGPRERKKRKTNATRNVHLGKMTTGLQDQHMHSLSRKSGGDERSKLSLGNEIKEPPALSYLDNTCSQSQYVDSPDVSEDSGNETGLSENHHTLKSPDNPTDDEPRERKKRKANATSNGCPGETTSCDPLLVESETISTTAVPQNSPRVPCKDILVWQQATSQDKPLNEDVLNCPQRGGSPKKSRQAAHLKGARRTRSSHVVHDSASVEAETTSMPAVRHTNQGATCRNTSIGWPATQEKPVCKKSKRDRLFRVVHVQDECIPCTFNSCDRKFKRLHHRDSHVERIHSLKKTPLVCGFEGCPEVFFTKHVKSIHEKSSAHVEVGPETEMYKCHYQGCTSTFPERRTFIRHLREVHGQGECIPCTLCNMTFKRKELLDGHVERIHNLKDTPLVCGFKGCGEVFFTKHVKSIHEKSSAHVELDTHGAKMIKCAFEGCRATFSLKRNHSRHYKEKHKKTSASRGESGRPRKKNT